MALESNHRPSLSLYSIGDEADSLYDEFRGRLENHAEPAIEKFLERLPEEHRGKLLVDLILLEVEYRRVHGDEPAGDEYRARFAGYEAYVDSIPFDGDYMRSRMGSGIQSIFAPGDKLLHYNLVEKVGEGTFGEVWKAQDSKLSRTVAVKLPHPRNINQSRTGLALREAQVAAKLSHPNVVAVHAVEDSGETLLIVTDFIDGSNLRDWKARSQLALNEIAQLCSTLAAALHHAHERGIVHRDLKPANVLIDSLGQPHIADFGLAKSVSAEESIASEGRIMGTPAYMSPEQARGDSYHVDRRADVFAMGVILYELLTGKKPFQGERNTVLRAIIEDEPKFPRQVRPEVPYDLETICLKALEKEPDCRYQTMQDLANDLDRFLKGESISARRPTLVASTFRWFRGRPFAASSWTLATLAPLALGIILYLFLINRALVGLRNVTITTDKPNAQIAIAPLDENTGEPDASAVTFPKGRTPLTLRLAPGDYFIVVLSGDGSFHEVYRHVPNRNEIRPAGIYAHQKWREGDNGDIILPKIRITQPDVKKMANFESFFLDRFEFTVAQREVQGNFPDSVSNNEKLEGCHAQNADYDMALALAENAGKRLPFDREYQVALRYAEKAPPVVPSTNHSSNGFGCVNVTPPLDAVLVRGDWIFGLRSNVAEWSASGARIGSSRCQIVRGAGEDNRVIDGENILPRDMSVSIYLHPHEHKPGLGFRAARSANPMFFASR